MDEVDVAVDEWLNVQKGVQQSAPLDVRLDPYRCVRPGQGCFDDLETIRDVKSMRTILTLDHHV